MKYSYTVFLLLLAFIMACASPRPQRDFFSLADHSPVVLIQDSPAIHQYWDIPNEPALWEPLSSEIAHLEQYKDSLKLVLGEEKFEEALAKKCEQQANAMPPSAEEPGYKSNSYMVYSGKLGAIRPINNLEAQLLNYQISRYPMLGHPTEFHGFILRDEQSERVRVYFCSSDTPWPPKPGVIIDSMRQNLAEGWELYRHLHNHYDPDSTDYIGVLAPSMADAHYYKMLAENYGIDKALITNGFNTVEIDHTEFEEFKSH